MKPKIQSSSSATYLALLNVRNYQGITSLVVAMPANHSFTSTLFQEKMGLK